MDTIIKQMRKEWPNSWKRTKEDISLGKRLVEEFIQFVEYLNERNLSKRTISRHVDNLWLLGGEIVDRIALDKEERGTSSLELLMFYISEEEGPLVSSITEGELLSLDATCRKLHKYLLQKMQVQA